MPWCPKCKCEYREGFEICSDCNSILTHETEETIETMLEYDEENYLTSVCDEFEANILETLLNSNGIPILKKFPGAGGYLSLYMGKTSSGIDIYVPSKLFDFAKELVDSKYEVDLGEDNIQSKEEENLLYEEEIKIHQKITTRTWIILLFFMPGFVVSIMYLIVLLWKFFSK